MSVPDQLTFEPGDKSGVSQGSRMGLYHVVPRPFQLRWGRKVLKRGVGAKTFCLQVHAPHYHARALCYFQDVQPHHMIGQLVYPENCDCRNFSLWTMAFVQMDGLPQYRSGVTIEDRRTKRERVLVGSWGRYLLLRKRVFCICTLVTSESGAANRTLSG
jgi:hypothetical protein